MECTVLSPSTWAVKAGAPKILVKAMSRMLNPPV
jgi:hypothetical protein